MRRPDPETLDALAGEYVLGTLAGPARRRFERWIETDAEVRELVDAWQERLATMAADVPERPPSPAVWDGIARELGHVRRGGGEAQRVTRRQFWFGFGSAAATASVLGGVVGVLAWPETSYAFPTHYCLLRNRENRLAWIVAIHADHGHFQVHDVPEAPDAPRDKNEHLWMLAAGKPLHFGPIADDVRKPLPELAKNRIDGATFVVSFEDRNVEVPAAPPATPVYIGKAVDARMRPLTQPS